MVQVQPSIVARGLVCADDSADSTKEDRGLILELLDTAYAFSRQDGSKSSDADDALWQQVGLIRGAEATAIRAPPFHGAAGIFQAGDRHLLRSRSSSTQARMHTEAEHQPACHSIHAAWPPFSLPRQQLEASQEPLLVCRI